MKTYIGPTQVYLGTAGSGSAASTLVAKTAEEGVSEEYKREGNEIYTEDHHACVLDLPTKEIGTITLNFFNGDLDDLHMAIAGSTNSGGVLRYGSVAEVTRSMKLVGYAVGADGVASHIKTTVYNYVKAVGDVKTDQKKGFNVPVPVTFKVMADTTVTDGSGDMATVTETSA